MKSIAVLLIAAAGLLAGCATAPSSGDLDIARFHTVNLAAVQLAREISDTLPEAERLELEGELLGALRDGVPRHLLADSPAPGAVRIELTVTELNASSPTVNLLTTALLFVPFDAGGVAFEARFYESNSREPFARKTFRYTSSPLELKGSFSRYGHAKRAMHDWAEALTTRRAKEG